MKLHLPTALFALAVLPAVAFAEENPYFIIDDYKDQYEKITDYIIDGHTQVVVNKADTSGDPTAVTPNSTDVAIIDKSLSLGEGDSINCNSPAKVLYIDGDLSVKNGASVYVGGSSGQCHKGGIAAQNVTIDGIKKAKEEGFDFKVGAALFETLTVNSGCVSLRRDGSDNGGSLHGAGYDMSHTLSGAAGYKGNFEFSNVSIANGLTVNGGYLEVGQTSNPKNETYEGFHCRFGDTNGYFQSTIGNFIHQEGGEIDLHGMTYLHTSEITQNGGEMTIASKNMNGKEVAQYVRIAGDMTINQGGSNADSRPVLKLEGIIVNGGAPGNGALKLTISQTGNGTIQMETSADSYERVQNPSTGSWSNEERTGAWKGSYFTSEPGKESLISQSGSGTININSDYTSATFNVEQTGKGGNITIGATGKLQSDALTLTDASTFTIARSSKDCGLSLNKDAEVTFAVSSLVSTYTGNTGGLVVEDGGNFTAEGGDLVSVKVVFSDDVVMSALTELTSAENKVLGTCKEVLVATGDVSKALTFAPGVYEKEYDLGNGTTATVEFAYDFTNEGNQVFANVTATVTGTGTTPAVPEPTTATLSLLALAGLCARRRRK